jgi:hypothetical protein
MVVQRSLHVETEPRPANTREAPTTYTYQTASDLIGLSIDVPWSDAPRDHDQARVRDRVRVDERVLMKANTDDLPHGVDPDELIESSPRIVHRSFLRRPWNAWRHARHQKLAMLTRLARQVTLVAAGEVSAQDMGVAAPHSTEACHRLNRDES